MQKAMAEVKKHSEVKDILLDLSSNGGGYLVAFFRVLGFLSDDTFDYSTYDTLSKIYADYGYEIDTDLDGIYADDAYEQYRWSILTSINTFSAANAFVSECKEKRIAKTIGEASGGGMCSIMTTVISDGTLLTISSNNTLRYLQKDGDDVIYREIESGFAPDIELSNDYFYDDSKLVEYIDKAYDE
jgi:C-terminal processing protease CtpA/Prc